MPQSKSTEEEMTRILIAEDSATQAEQLRHTLEQNGYDVMVARNGREALDAIHRQPPTLVVSDIVMPEMDGYDLCHHIKGDNDLQDIPVILLTALSDPVDVIRGLECGADHFLMKPCNEKYLLSRITTVLANRQMAQTEVARFGVEIYFEGRKHFITSERLQILNLLLSSYESAVHKNRELAEAQAELERLNEQLEKKVRERTAAVEAEIEEHRRTEAQLQQAQKMEAIGQLAGGVAHDFNNMLSVILGYAEIMKMELDPGGKLNEFLDEIKTAGQRAATLTRQLLAFSRQQVLQPEILDLNKAVQEIEKMLRRLIGEDIDLQCRLASGLRRVKADRGQIEQVIMNLAVNARDAMPQGGVLVLETANVELDEEYARRHASVVPGLYVMLAVSDTGYGMDKETQARIFEPFFTTKEKGKGTGLGLSTVYGIVEQSGGSIWLYSEQGRGTTFKVYFPQTTDQGEARRTNHATDVLTGGSETILLVEDEEAVRVLAQRILERYGYTVLVAENGDRALEIAEKQGETIHLVITDVVMPTMSGPELTVHLQSSFPNMKALFISGYTDKTIAHHGVLETASLVQKPFTPSSLLNRVREVLDA